MKRPPSKVALIALAAGLATLLALPASGQDSPESLLPPGFGDPVPAGPAAPPPPPPGRGDQQDVPTLTLAPPPPAAGDPLAAALGEAATGVDDEETAGPVELPDHARRPVDVTGPLGPDGTGLGMNAFGTANGLFLSTLMRRVEAPIASRWASILLRRALLSRVPSPSTVPPADWVAERAWLLLRMGEADGARMLVQGVDVDRYTPKLLAVAAQAALATADPAGLCPLVAPAQAAGSQEPIWPLAHAMCTGLSGDAATSGGLIDRARRARVARGIDLLLAEKVVGAGGGRRQINIEWTGVDQLTSWRFGLATALGVAVPDPLFATVGPHVLAWRARSAMVPLATRIEAARTAAALGVLSNAALVDLYATQADETDAAEIAGSPAGRLRTAYVGADQDARMTALRSIWTGTEDARGRYGDAILTARAAARIAPNDDYADDSAALIGAMLSAGLDYQADRWAGIVEGMSASSADPAWAMLAVGTPTARVDVSYRRVSAFAGRADRHRAQLLLAGLAGLGRLSSSDVQRLATDLEMPIGQTNRWTRAIDLAAANGQPGTVALLAAAGLQTRSWAGVPPAYLYHIVSALRRVGREGDARMIAAEAMSRT
jgi:hypothetical protein